MLYLPGNTFVEALFPDKLSVETGGEKIGKIERLALSLGMSIVIVPIVGLILNYTPWGIRLIPITLSLLALTLIFAMVAVLRRLQIELHSPTSQYGSMSRGIRYASPDLRAAMQLSLREIQEGTFAKEFAAEYELGLEILDDMKEMAEDIPIVYFDDAVRKKLQGHNEKWFDSVLPKT